MRPDQRKKEWCLYYSLSDSSRTRRVRSSTSRRSPSRTSLDLQLRFGFFPTRLADATSDIAHLATLERLFVWESVWRPSSLIWSASSLGMRRLCVVATPAFPKRPLEPGPVVEANRGPAPSTTFPTPCRFAPAWVKPHPSSTKLAIFQAALAPAAAMCTSTPSAESFAIACGWPVWKFITYLKD